MNKIVTSVLATLLVCSVAGCYVVDPYERGYDHRGYEREREHDRDRGYERDRDREHERELEREREHDRDQRWDRDR